MWRDIRPELEEKLPAAEDLTRRWIEDGLAKERLIGFVARTSKNRIVGSGCLWIRPEQPRPTNPRLEVPYLMSMYTESEFRGRGVARRIVQEALKWCREMRYDRVVLHASRQGMPLYESIGFEPTTEMVYRFKPAPKA